ncbi:nudix hydrolase 15, mitochondrial-like [Citrus sinensis]|uniref:nudix hydrolase 15, mitochondrial-like n=1 Tax=Citrus sinensis TaxID=2711 RepID=UPI000D62D3D6|nr:nudix hydrolase 15, mitochondrial-like [Citrus sinensis]
MDIELVGCNIKDEQNYCGNQTLLQRIAEQLQVNKPTSSNEQQVDGDDDRIIGSNLGIMESVAKQNEHRRAAVLICVFEEGHGGELRVILTKRSMNLSSYPGDVALPEGKMEDGDADDSATALREAMEEIGLDPHLVQVAAHLEPFNSKNQLNVVPVIGLLAKMEDFKPFLNPDEVDAIFDVPLEMFFKGDNHKS